jgi:hypothetical protein
MAEPRYNVDRAKVARLLETGMKQTEIAVECGCTPKTITFIKQELLGLRDSPTGRTGRAPHIDRDRARKLLEAGLSSIHVAESLGCHTSTVVDLKRELGFPVASFKKGQGNAAKGHRSPNNPGAIRMKRQSRLNSMAEHAARCHRTMPDKVPVFELEPFLPGIETAPNKQPRSVPAVRLVASDSEPESLRVPFHKLERKQCAWFTSPIIRFHAHEAECCGHDVEQGKAYCPHHNARAVDKRKTEESREAA